MAVARKSQTRLRSAPWCATMHRRFPCLLSSSLGFSVPLRCFEPVSITAEARRTREKTNNSRCKRNLRKSKAAMHRRTPWLLGHLLFTGIRCEQDDDHTESIYETHDPARLPIVFVEVRRERTGTKHTNRG